MHPIDILNFYRNRYLYQISVNRREVFGQQLNVKDMDPSYDPEKRKKVVKIRHDLLDAVKHTRELEHRHEKVATEEPKEEKKEVMVVATARRRKKKKQN